MKFRIVTKSDKFFSPVAQRDDYAVQRKAFFIWRDIQSGLSSKSASTLIYNLMLISNGQD